RVLEQWFAHARRALQRDPAGEHARAYLTQRQVHPDLWDQIGWVAPHALRASWLSPEQMESALALDVVRRHEQGLLPTGVNRLLFPLTNAQGQVVGFSYRDLSGESERKYINTKETPVFKKSHAAFVAHPAAAAGGALAGSDARFVCCLCEGPFDALALAQAGYTAFACCGTTVSAALGQRVARDFLHCVLVPDTDQAGMSSVQASLRTLLSVGLLPHVAVLPPGKDPGDFTGDPQQLALAVDHAVGWSEFILRHDVRIASLMRARTDPIGVLRAVLDYLEVMPDEERQRVAALWFDQRVRVQEGTCWRLLQRGRVPSRAQREQRLDVTSSALALVDTVGTLMRLAVAHPKLARSMLLPNWIPEGPRAVLQALAQAQDRHQALGCLEESPEASSWLQQHPEARAALSEAAVDSILLSLTEAEAQACWNQAILRHERRLEKARGRSSVPMLMRTLASA
ncbi:MAG: toprim domain-containing protein, partial [Rectinema sp.]|nr:toprim domain-containing protein [Rectinema sp.]